MKIAKPHAVVLGAGGLAGGELLRLLSAHPAGFRITALSKSGAGKPAADVHKALLHCPAIEFCDLPVESACEDADVVFCALPHGQSQGLMRQILSAGPICVVDLAADFRLRDAARFEEYFGSHESPDLIERFAYGLPEIYADQIREKRLVANPGCFATAAQLLLLPLASFKVLPETTAVFAVTGSSGSGIRAKAGTHHPFRANNFYSYKMLAHQHEPEIAQTLGALTGTPARCRLLAHSGSFVRGIHATCHLSDERLSSMKVSEVYDDYYQKDPFVTVLDRPPEVAEVAATNHVHIGVAQQGGEIQVSLALDNLVKGAAGQAIENMNLVCGYDQTDGLTFPGVFPC